MKEHKVQNQSNIKVNNCKLVLEIIRANQDSSISRADIAKITKMSATSITRITDLLLEYKLIELAGNIRNDGVGRRGIHLKIVKDAVLTVGISLDSDYVDVCILDFLGNIVLSKKKELEDRSYPPEELLDIGHDILTEISNEANISINQIVAIGIACIGNVDHKTGKVFFAPQFKWKDVELGKIASTIFQQPVFVDNDMKAALVGLAHRSEDIRYEDVTYLSIGMGVGAAVMYKGRLMRGSNNAAGEIGHVILEPNGRPCDCKQVGCVQTYLTRNSLIELCQEEGRDITKVEQIYKAYRDQEEWAKRFVDRQADHMAMLIRNLVYMYNTKYILIGGAIISDFPEMFYATKQKLKYLLHENLYTGLKLKKVDGKDNSVIGAAFVAQRIYIEQLLFEKELYD